jgi:PadR family transcriptional regulator PadR
MAAMKMKFKRTNPDYVNGVPELLILNMLARHPMHGYELVQALQRRAGETIAFGEGCVYPILHRLEHEKFLRSHRETVGAKQRVVYHVTVAGRKRLAERVTAWHHITRVIARELEGGEDATVKLA